MAPVDRPRWLFSWCICSAAYFLVSLAVALVAHGLDLDQLTSRSAASRAAAHVDRLLWSPYHWVGRHLAPDLIRSRATTPALLVGNALAWGAVLAAAWRWLGRHQRRA